MATEADLHDGHEYCERSCGCAMHEHKERVDHKAQRHAQPARSDDAALEHGQAVEVDGEREREVHDKERVDEEARLPLPRGAPAPDELAQGAGEQVDGSEGGEEQPAERGRDGGAKLAVWADRMACTDQ